MNIVDELHAIAAALRRAGIPYAVCGGIAVTAYGATRSTKDEAAYADTLDDRVDVPLPGGPITFVSRDTLLRMKRLAGRPIDLADIESLEDGDAP